jgi:hypothetical protein
VEPLKRIVPVMARGLVPRHRAAGRGPKICDAACGLELAREAQWARSGETNSKIASLSWASENTIKHHLTKTFGNLAMESRGQLVQRLAEHEAKAVPGFGTRTNAAAEDIRRSGCLELASLYSFPRFHVVIGEYKKAHCLP